MKVSKSRFGKTKHIPYRKWIKEKYNARGARECLKNETLQARIAFRISELRQKNNLTQKQLARLLHTKQQVVSRIEQPDNASITLNTLYRLAEVFHKNLVVEFR